MQLIIDTNEEYAPMFRAVAKAVNAKVTTGRNKPNRAAAKGDENIEKEPTIDPGTAKSGDKPSDFFKGAWQKDPTRTAQSIREAAWKRNG
jgi:hypothetical protein